MHSRDASIADLEAVASWVGSQRECERWAGPGIPFPLEPLGLATRIDMPAAVNVALDDERGLVAFGQALPRSPGRAHLARVIVRPDARKRGIGKALVEALLVRAARAGLTRVTLNVYADNTAAMNLYAGMGFRRAERPRGDPDRPGTWFLQRIDGPAAD